MVEHNEPGRRTEWARQAGKTGRAGGQNGLGRRAEWLGNWAERAGQVGRTGQASSWAEQGRQVGRTGQAGRWDRAGGWNHLAIRRPLAANFGTKEDDRSVMTDDYRISEPQ